MDANLTKAELVSLVQGKTIQLIGFGSFSSVQKAARTGRNPQTGNKINIPAKRFPKFKPGKNLRDVVNEKKKRKKK